MEESDYNLRKVDNRIPMSSSKSKSKKQNETERWIEKDGLELG